MKGLKIEHITGNEHCGLLQKKSAISLIAKVEDLDKWPSEVTRSPIKNSKKEWFLYCPLGLESKSMDNF